MIRFGALPLGNRVTIPIFLRNPLGYRQRLLRMCRLWKRPPDRKVTAEGHDKHSFTPLGYAEIGCVEEPERSPVFQSPITFGGMVLFKPLQMPVPRLSRFGYQLGIAQAEENVLKIAAKCLTKEPFDVLNKDGLRLRFANGTNHLGEEIPLVVLPFMLAALGPRLAWDATCKQLNIGSKVGVIEGTHIGLKNRPIPHIL